MNLLANATFAKNPMPANILLTQSFVRCQTQNRPKSTLTNFSNKEDVEKQMLLINRDIISRRQSEVRERLRRNYTPESSIPSLDN
jgi:hypothetical protein